MKSLFTLFLTMVTVTVLSSGAVGQVLTAEEDWQARSTAPGVMLATNFDVQTEVTDWVHQDSAADHVRWETAEKASGAGSLRFDIRSGDQSNSGNWVRWFDESWDDGTFGQGFKTGDEFFLSFRVWYPASYMNMQMLDRRNFSPSSYNVAEGRKLAIISNYKASFQPYELVPTDHKDSRFFTGYHQNGGVNHWSRPVSSSCGMTPDFNHQPEIDIGPQVDPTKTACELDRMRFGSLTSYRIRQDFVDGVPDPLAPGKTIVENRWQSVMIHMQVGTFNLPGGGVQDSHLRFWVADPGEDWTLIYDSAIDIGSNGGGPGAVPDVYNAVWLVPFNSFMQEDYAQDSQTKALLFPRPDTFVLYDELVVSTNFISAPNFAGSSSAIRPNPPGNLLIQ